MRYKQTNKSNSIAAFSLLGKAHCSNASAQNDRENAQRKEVARGTQGPRVAQHLRRHCYYWELVWSEIDKSPSIKCHLCCVNPHFPLVRNIKDLVPFKCSTPKMSIKLRIH